MVLQLDLISLEIPTFGRAFSLSVPMNGVINNHAACVGNKDGRGRESDSR